MRSSFGGPAQEGLNAVRDREYLKVSGAISGLRMNPRSANVRLYPFFR